MKTTLKIIWTVYANPETEQAAPTAGFILMKIY